MGLMICDRIIMFFLGLMIFFLPISRAVIEVSASICIFTWAIKRILILRGKKDYNLLDKSREFFFRTSSLNKTLMVFIFANFLAMIFSSNIKLSLNAFFAKLLEYILIFVMVRDTVNSKLRCRALIWITLCSVSFIGLDGLFQAVSGYDLFRHRHLFQDRVTASFINPNDLGSYLITIIPLSLALIFAGLGKKIRSALIIVCLVTALTLLLTFSKSAGLSFFCGLIFFGFYTKKRYALFIFAGMFILTLISPLFFNFSFLNLCGRIFSFFSDPGAMDRKFLWAAALRMFAARPVFGVGLGTFMENYQKFWLRPTTEISYAHNCYLQMLAETGIIGLGAFTLFLFIWFRKTLGILSKPAKTFYYPQDSFAYFSFLGLSTGIIAYLVNSFVDTNFYSLPIAVLFWFVLGLQVSAIKLIKNE